MSDHSQYATQRDAQIPTVIAMSWTLMSWAHTALALGAIAAAILSNLVDLDLWPKIIGIATPAFILLVPIWTLLLAGVLVSLVAWVTHPDYHRKLDLSKTHEIERRPDGNMFGPLVRHLGGFTASLVCLAGIGSFSILLSEENPAPLAIMGVYWMICLSGFICYLIWFYHEDRDRVTASYLMMLWVLWGFALIPLAWPLIVFLNRRVRRVAPKDSFGAAQP